VPTDLSATDLAATTGMVFEEPLLGTATGDQETARGLATALWFSALITLVVLVAQACGRARRGTWAVTFGILGLAPVIVNGADMVPLTVGLVAFGVGVDSGTVWARPHPLAFGAAAALMWAAYFIALSSQGDLTWNRQLWGGVIATGLLGRQRRRRRRPMAHRVRVPPGRRPRCRAACVARSRGTLRPAGASDPLRPARSFRRPPCRRGTRHCRGPRAGSRRARRPRGRRSQRSGRDG
jgi:hypothetical protein